MGKHRKRDTDSEDESPSSASSSSISSYSSDESNSSSRRRRKKRKKRRKSDGGYEREKRRKREKEKKRKMMERRERKRKDRKKRSKRSKKRRYESDTDTQSGSDSMSDQESPRDEPEAVVKEMLVEFPNVGNDLKQLLKMIDDGQAVDIKGISESALKKRLKKLFVSLKLKERGDRVFLLPPGASPCLDLVGHLIKGDEEEEVEKNLDDSAPLKKTEATTTGNENDETKKGLGDENSLSSNIADDVAGPKKR